MIQRRWALDAANRRFQVGDLVMTTKRSRFGPGLLGPVSSITTYHVSVAVNLDHQSVVTVWHQHVLIKKRHSGLRVRLGETWRRVRERAKR